MSGFPSTPTQQAVINNFGTGVSATLSATAAGSLIIVEITSQLASGNSSSVTDNVGNTYTMVTVVNTSITQRHIEHWYCLSAAAGVTTVTVNNAAGTNVGGTVTEWAGGSSGLRNTASSVNASGVTNPVANVAATAGDLVIGSLGYQAATASTRQETLVTPGSGSTAGFTALTPVTRGTTTMHAGVYEVVPSTGTWGPSWTMSPGVATACVTTAFAPSSSPAPTAAFTATIYGHTVKLDASASSAQGAATITGYAWAFGDSNSGSGATTNHRYTSAGTYTITLTVTDSNGQTGTITHSVTAVDGGTSAYFVSLSTTTGYTAVNAASVLAAISDTDNTSFVTATGPSSLPLKGLLGSIQPPATGQPFVVVLTIDRVTSSSGSILAKLYDFDGTTLRSTVSSVLIPDMTVSGGTGSSSSGTVVGTAILSFPWSDVQSMTASGWDAATLEIQETAA